MKSNLENSISLKPNCLITQNPIVFGSGKKSFFYSERYWHFYPEYLAEHGYPVFHFFFPQTINSYNAEKLRENFDSRSGAGQKWHLIVDQFRLDELIQFNLQNHPIFSSITILSENKGSASKVVFDFCKSKNINSNFQEICTSRFQNHNTIPFTFKLHQWLTQKKSPSAHILGLIEDSKYKIAEVLLERTIELAENDFIAIESNQRRKA